MTAPSSKPSQFSPRANLYFLVMSILCQAIAMGGVTFVKNSAPINAAGILILHSIIAFAGASLLRLPIVWRIFNLLIVPAIVLYPSLGLPQGVLALVVVTTAMLYLPTLWTRVPFYPTSPATYSELLNFIPLDKPIKVLDIGSGFGGLLIYLAKRRPLAKIHGVEISPLPLLISKLKAVLMRCPNVKIQAKNFWKSPLVEYDIVYAFLSPAPMPKLWQKVKNEMRPGTVFISNSFPAPEQAAQEIAVADRRGFTLFVYRL